MRLNVRARLSVREGVCVLCLCCCVDDVCLAYIPYPTQTQQDDPNTHKLTHHNIFVGDDTRSHVINIGTDRIA